MATTCSRPEYFKDWCLYVLSLNYLFYVVDKNMTLEIFIVFLLIVILLFIFGFFWLLFI